MHRRSWTALALVASLVAAACSGDDDDDQAAPTTTDTPPLITSAGTPPTTVPEASAPANDHDRMPLTGEIVDDPDDLPDRPALIVKIDNIWFAWPQYGLNQADLIFEEIINDGVTRFAAVFHSEDAERVGPIRSGRLQDIDLLGLLNRPLFAWSGGNSTVEAAVAESDLVSLRHGDYGDLYYRDHEHADQTEWTLFSGTPELFGAELADGDDPGRPTTIFDYLEPDESFEGTQADGLVLQLDTYEARWEWDDGDGLYRRWTNDEVHETADDGQLTTDNVVVLQMEYVDQIGSPDAVTANASGPAWVFTDGEVAEARWSRAGRRDGFQLTTRGDDPEPVALPPGRTFIELPRNTDEGIPEILGAGRSGGGNDETDPGDDG